MNCRGPLLTLILGLGILLGGCKTTDRVFGKNKNSNDSKDENSGLSPEELARKNACIATDKKVWNASQRICQSPAEMCVSKKDGSVWVNGNCLTLENQCVLANGKWDGSKCFSAQMLCQEKPGHVWRGERCLNSEEDCLGQDKGYRFKWEGHDEASGECKIKSFLDFCKEGLGAPRDIQYSVAILMRLAGVVKNCQATDAWIRKTISVSHVLEIYDTQDQIKLKDISPIVSYSEIEELRLTNNEITDLTPLGELKNLKVLDLQNNKIENLLGLQSLVHLQTLYLGNNLISNITSLQGLSSLKKLHLFDNRMSDLSALENLTNLEVLYLKTNAIGNVYPLRNLHKLQDLDLSENPILSSDVAKSRKNCPYGDGVSKKLSDFCKPLVAP